MRPAQALILLLAAGQGPDSAAFDEFGLLLAKFGENPAATAARDALWQRLDDRQFRRALAGDPAQVRQRIAAARLRLPAGETAGHREFDCEVVRCLLALRLAPAAAAELSAWMANVPAPPVPDPATVSLLAASSMLLGDETMQRRARDLLTTCAAALPGQPLVAHVAARCLELGSSARQAAALPELEGLLAVAAIRAATKAGIDDVLRAIEAGAPAAGQPTAAHRAWFESCTASILCRIGCSAQAMSRLQRFFAERIDPAALEPRARRWHAAGTLLLAELLDSCSDEAAATVERTFVLLNHPQPPAADAAALGNLRVEALGIKVRIAVRLERYLAAWEALTRMNSELARLEAPDPTTREKACMYEVEFYLAQDRVAAARRVLAELERTQRTLSPHLLLRRWLIAVTEAELEGRVDDVAAAELTRLLPEVDAESAAMGRIVLVRAAVAGQRFAAAHAELQRLRELMLSLPRQEGSAPARAAEIELQASRLLRCEFEAAANADENERRIKLAALRAQLPRHRAAFELLLAEWASTKVLPDGIGFLARPHRCQVLTEMFRLMQILDGEAAAAKQAAIDLVRAQRLTSLARELGADDVDLAAVRALFATPGAGILMLLAEPKGSFVLAVDAERERLFVVPERPRLQRLAQELQSALRAPGTGGADDATEDRGARILQQATALAAVLLTDDLRQHIARWHTITVADFGMLGGLPWECLPWAPDRLLGETKAINMLTSLPLGVTLFQQRYRPEAIANTSVQLVATLSGSRELTGGTTDPTLRIDDDMVTQLLSAYASTAAERNENATCQRIAALSFAAPVTHFFAHGAQRDGVVGLALHPSDGNDGFFGREQAATLSLRGLVIVSACRAGRAARRQGDDALFPTLGGSLLRAGAIAVVQSDADHWLRSHLRLMEKVHAGIARGQAPASALCTARAELAARNPAWTERFEHAQVQVFGLGQLPIFR